MFKSYNSSPFVSSRVIELMTDLYWHKSYAMNYLKKENEESILDKEIKKAKEGGNNDIVCDLENFKKHNKVLMFEYTVKSLIELTILKALTLDFKQLKIDLRDMIFDLNTFENLETKEERYEFEKAKALIYKSLENAKSSEKFLVWYDEHRQLVDRAIINELCHSDYLKYVGDITDGEQTTQVYNLAIIHGGEDYNENLIHNLPNQECSLPGMNKPYIHLHLNSKLEIVEQESVTEEDIEFTLETTDISSVHDLVNIKILLNDTVYKLQFSLVDYLTIMCQPKQDLIKNILQILSTVSEVE